MVSIIALKFGYIENVTVLNVTFSKMFHREIFHIHMVTAT